MLNEYNKIKPLTVVTPSRVPWCSCSRDCPMSWDCLGGNPGAKLVLESYGIISSTSLQQKGGLQPPLKSSYQEVGCAVGWCAGFQRNQSLKEGFFWGEPWGKKRSTVGIEAGWDQRGSVDAGACFGWAANLLITFTIFHPEAQIIFLQPIHGISFGTFAPKVVLSAICSSLQETGSLTGEVWAALVLPFNPCLLPCSVLKLSVVQAGKMNIEDSYLLMGCA